MDYPTLIGVILSDVRVTMAILLVLVVEWLCQAMKERIPVLQCQLSGVCGLLRLHLVIPGIKWSRYLRTPAIEPFARYLGYPRAWLSGAWVHAQPGCKDKLD
jgi:hypothetical protein